LKTAFQIWKSKTRRQNVGIYRRSHGSFAEAVQFENPYVYQKPFGEASHLPKLRTVREDS